MRKKNKWRENHKVNVCAVMAVTSGTASSPTPTSLLGSPSNRKQRDLKFCLLSIKESDAVGEGRWVGVYQVYYCNRPCMLLLSTLRGISVVSDLLHTYLIKESHP